MFLDALLPGFEVVRQIRRQVAFKHVAHNRDIIPKTMIPFQCRSPSTTKKIKSPNMLHLVCQPDMESIEPTADMVKQTLRQQTVEQILYTIRDWHRTYLLGGGGKIR